MQVNNKEDGMETKRKKIGKMNEAAWILGILLCTLGVCLCTKANFGISMIGAPPYILHLWLRDALPWYTQGMSEYVWQGIILVVTCIAIMRFKLRYIVSFGTAILSGLSIDMWLFIFGGNGAYENMVVRIVAFALGELITSVAIAFIFRTTLPVQIYELAVCEIADRYKLKRDRVKLVNDIVMLAISITLALVLTGGWNGIGVGTIVITFVNAPLITLAGKVLDRIFEFDSRFPKLFG